MNRPRPARTARVKGEPEAMVHRLRCISVCVFTWCFVVRGGRGAGRERGDWFHMGTGLGVDKPRVAVADFGSRADNAKSHSQLFTQVVRDDLQFSGIIDLVSPSFYAVQVPSVPGELRNSDWTTPQVNSNLIAFGNVTEAATEVVISGWLFDVRSPSTQAV